MVVHRPCTTGAVVIGFIIVFCIFVVIAKVEVGFKHPDTEYWFGDYTPAL